MGQSDPEVNKQHIKEGKYAFRWTRLSCERFCDNEVRLQLHALAYNLATFVRCFELPELPEVAVTGPIVRDILAAIRRLRARPSRA